MPNHPLIAMTAGEAAVAIAVIIAATALILVVVWQIFSLARRKMELQASEPGEGNRSPVRGEEQGS